MRPDHNVVFPSLWEHLVFITDTADVKGSDHYPLHARFDMRGLEILP